MAINIELGNLYGMNSEKELMETIEELRGIGMPDEEVQKILDRSKDKKEDEA